MKTQPTQEAYGFIKVDSGMGIHIPQKVKLNRTFIPYHKLIQIVSKKYTFGHYRFDRIPVKQLFLHIENVTKRELDILEKDGIIKKLCCYNGLTYKEDRNDVLCLYGIKEIEK